MSGIKSGVFKISNEIANLDAVKGMDLLLDGKTIGYVTSYNSKNNEISYIITDVETYKTILNENQIGLSVRYEGYVDEQSNQVYYKK